MPSRVLNINKQSNMANVLKKCKLIVWDDSSMSHKKKWEALNNCVTDLRNSNLIMEELQCYELEIFSKHNQSYLKKHVLMR